MNMNVLADALMAAAKVLNGAESMPVRETKALRVTKKQKLNGAVEDDVVCGDDDGTEDELDSDDAPAVTAEQLMRAFKTYVASFDDVKEGRLEAKKILKKFKAASVSEIDTDDYVKALAALEV